MELVTGLSFSLFGFGHGYRNPQPPQVVVNVLPPPCNCRACRGTKKKKKKKKKTAKKKKLYPQYHPEVGRRWYPSMENHELKPRHPSLAAGYTAGGATRQNSFYEYAEKHSAAAMGARGGNNTSTYCRRTRQVYESEEEEEEIDEEEEEEEESESDDESEESESDEEEEDDDDDDESDGEEAVHQHQLPAGRGRGIPEEHLRSRRPY